jgi:hypothetical protein
MENLLKEEESAVFTRNKWVKRMNTLNSEGIRETI